MTGIKVLVADDEITVRAFIEAVIMRENLPVAALLQTDNGTDAIRIAGETRPDLILLDIRMPGTDGLRAAEMILAANTRANIVILSAHHEFDYVRTAFRTGVADYLLKPLKPADLAALIRKTAETVPPPPAAPAPNPIEISPLITAVAEYVSENLAQPLPLKEIAQTVFLSPSHLSRTFKQQTGQSLTAYIQEQRLQYAADLLLTTSDSISEIAGRAGFSDASYFATCFKGKNGVSPLQYRQDAKQPVSDR
ncbi:MAG TPA: response regulator [Patescibacteria group bacterium]|nr:response regulator [Patescibacteria group bacterium]